VVRLGEEEPALGEQSQVLDGERRGEQHGAAACQQQHDRHREREQQKDPLTRRRNSRVRP